MREKVIAIAIGVVGLMLSSALFIAESIKTGVESLDRLGIRARIAVQALLQFGPKAATDLRIPRALMAIVNNESKGNPSFYLGDATLGGGPSIGPMQVYRTTAKDLGLWTPPKGATIEQERAAYAVLAMNEGLGIEWGVRVFAEKYRIAKGDIATAVRLYNGSGPGAEAYREKALAFATSKWGSIT